MPITRSRRALAAVASAALTAGAITLAIVPPAHALPVFTESDMDGDSSAFNLGATPCTTVQNASTPLANVPVVENGAATTGSASQTGTITNNGDNTDVINYSTSITGTDRVTSVGGNPGTIELNATGNVAVSTTKPVSACQGRGYSFVDLDFTFTVAQAGVMTISTKASRGSYGDIYIENLGTGSSEFEIYGEGNRFNGTASVFLSAGTYTGYLEADAIFTTSTAFSAPVNVSVKGSFAVAGSQTEAVKGKGKKYVTLPSARSCATHAVVPSITGKKKRANQVKQVTFFVNDTKVKKVKTPDKGDSVTLPVADDVAAEVVAEVKLLPKRKGRPGKVVEVSASYEACS